jgi:hypothetical protein
MAQPASYGSVPFREQNEFLRRKLPSVDYFAVRGAAHDHSFVVAGAHRVDMVADIQQVLQSALDNGDTLEAFREDFAAVLDNYGWQPDGGKAWRSRVIYETNLRTSYAAGRYQQLQAVKATRPYWMYEHSDAVITPRPEHEAWHGLVLAADDPWWQIHYPPNGWGCQCGVRALNDRDLKRMGKDGPDQAPASKTRRVMHKGEVVEVPEGIDPGWGYAPGRSALERQVQHSLSKTERLPAAPAASMAQQLLQHGAVSRAVDNDWRRLLDDVVLDGKARGRSMVLGSLSPNLVAGMAGAGVTPLTAAIGIGDAAMLRMLAGKGRDARAASAGRINNLPTALARPRAVLLDAGSDTLVYVYGDDLAVSVRYQVVGEAAANSVQQALDVAALRRRVQAGQLILLEGEL